MFDLLSAARGAVFRALTERVPPSVAQVYDDVPQGTQPPFLKIGTIDTENAGDKADQIENVTIEVYAVYRGADRGVLTGMMHAARVALDARPIAAPGAAFQLPRFLKQSASDASPADGVTYAGILNFEVLGEPA